MVTTRASTRASLDASDMQSVNLSKRMYDHIAGWANVSIATSIMTCIVAQLKYIQAAAGGSSTQPPAAPKVTSFPIEAFPSPPGSTSAQSSHPHLHPRSPVADAFFTASGEPPAARRTTITEEDIDNPLFETDPNYAFNLLRGLETAYRNSMDQNDEDHQELTKLTVTHTLGTGEMKQLAGKSQENSGLVSQMGGWRIVKWISRRAHRKAKDGDDGEIPSDDDDLMRDEDFGSSSSGEDGGSDKDGGKGFDSNNGESGEREHDHRGDDDRSLRYAFCQ
jgi:hypothetical protein